VTGPAPIRLVLVDDHPIVLQGLAQVLAMHEGLEIVATCHDGVAAVAVIRAQRPDVAVVDARLPGLDGLGIVQALRHDEGAPRFVLLTATLDERQAGAAIGLGVHGVVFKDMPVETLIACIRAVHGGGTWPAPTAAPVADGQRLTPREAEIVRMIADGLQNKEIAAQLGIGGGTVKVHLHRIYEKLGVDGRVELIFWAQAHGLG
jgi:DNA-binding NarL/FixJ family response regulator